jgi:hypothetical protein
MIGDGPDSRTSHRASGIGRTVGGLIMRRSDWWLALWGAIMYALLC